MIDYKEIYLEEHVKNGLTYSQIREKYNISRGTWDYYIRYKLGLKNDSRKYVAKDIYFDIIDTELKAYLLGFLYADGYISSDGRIGILLNRKDEEIVKLIRDTISPNSVINYTNYQNIKRSPQVKLRFRSKHIYKRLKDLGFTIDKTHTNCEILSNIPEQYKRHFIRGYCDGDGSVRYDLCLDKRRNKSYTKLGIVFCNGTPKILEEIRDYLNIPAILRKHKSWYTLEYYNKETVNSICKYLYEDCTYFLKRKYNNAMSIIKYCNNTELNSEIKKSESV